MAFPTLGTPALTETAPSSTAHAVNLPAERTIGRLMLLFVQFSDSEVPTGFTGWTQLHAFSSYGWRALYARIVVGDEQSQLPLTTIVAGRIAAICVEVSGWYGSDIASNVGVANSDYLSITDMPRSSPALSAAWGAADTLWLSAYMCDSTAALLQSPTDYGLVSERLAISTSSSSLWLYSRELATALEQPGSWNLGTKRSASILTVALRPAGAVAPPALFVRMTAHPSAASATGVGGVIFEWPATGYRLGPSVGEFSGLAFEAALEGGLAVLKIPADDYAAVLAVGNTPIVLAENENFTTGLVSAAVIEE